MGDDMAIRSGGMYGNPESVYTNAMPVSRFSGAGSRVGKFGSILNMFGTGVNAVADIKQLREKERTLEDEKQYNLKNYQQVIADTLAKNKMSFYSSGLDIHSGTAQDVMLSNTRALQEDMGIMQRNYDVQIENAKEAARARRISLGFEQAQNFVGLLF